MSPAPRTSAGRRAKPTPRPTPTAAARAPRTETTPRPARAPDRAAEVRGALAALQGHADPRVLEEMGPRYGIQTRKAYGVRLLHIQKVAKELGRDHDLAVALWATGWYEARLLACFVGEPERVTVAEMDRWCRDFDNWGICDTVCFKLWDRTPHAFGRVAKWAGRKEEFVRRAAFALLASLALHAKGATDADFRPGLALIEHAADDERNFVKKGVSWALRAIGGRRPGLRKDATALARRLAASASPAARWVGRDALRALK